MIQNNLVPKYNQPRPTRHKSQKHNLADVRLRLNQRHHLSGEDVRLILNKLEKHVLIIGVAIIVGLMFMLVTTKLTDDVYQHQIVATSTSVSKFHNLNNNSRQKVSELQRNGRLQKVAHKNHLRFSSHDVRNVK